MSLLFLQRRQLHSWVAKDEIKIQVRVCRPPGYYLVVIYGFWGLSYSHKLKNDSVNSSLMLNALTGTTHLAAEFWESTPKPHPCLTAQSDPACPTQPCLPPFVQVRFFSQCSHLFLFLPFNWNRKSVALALPGNFSEYKIRLRPFISAFLVGEVASLLATVRSEVLSIFYESLEVLTIQKVCSLSCL